MPLDTRSEHGPLKMSAEKTQHANLETILRPGQVVGGKYCVDKLLGKGGMAAVWAGTNQRTGKQVALKVILRSFASTAGADEMFRREALAASRVNHPNVVNVFDVVDHEGMACIVMELLDGEHLSSYLARKGVLSVEEAIALLLPAMRGVAAANARGIVHRDLKPQNIFLCMGPDGSVLTTKVLDFGIALVMEKATDPRAETVITTHGTPAYMSPEHITNAPEVDQRVDVYGFGVLLFEALTGHLPFSGEPGPSLLMRIVHEPAPKATLYRPDLPSAMVDIIECALAKEREARHPTLNHFIRLLEDQLLPASLLPRSLTPIMGISRFEHASETGVADPVMQILRREASGSQRSQPTQSLFVLSSGSDGLSVRSGLGQVGPHGDEAGAVVQRPGSGVRKVLASVGAFVGALLLVAWLATPRHHSAPSPTPPSASTAPRHPSSLTSRPDSVTPPVPAAPSVPSPTAPGMMAPPSPPAPVEPALVAPVLARPQPHPATQVSAKPEAHPGVPKDRARARRPVPSDLSVPLLAPPPVPPARDPAAPAPSRAGTLSPEDF